MTIELYSCVCGKTATTVPGQLLDCCRAAGITRVPLQELRASLERTIKRGALVIALVAFVFFVLGLVLGGILWR